MATLLSDIVDYIAANDSELIVDTNLFLGFSVVGAPDPSVIVREIPGSSENESGLIERSFQVVCKNKSYVDAAAKAASIYDLFNHKPGYSASGIGDHGIFYVEPISRPIPLEQDEQSSFVFVVDFVIRYA